MSAARRIAPYLIFIILFAFMTTTLANGIKNLHLVLSIPQTLVVAAFVGALGALICYFYISHLSQNAKINPRVAARQEELLYSLSKSEKHLLKAKMVSKTEVQGTFQEAINIVQGLIQKAKDRTKWKSLLSSDYRGVERIFAAMQIVTACFVAFAHGANDVANAIGPVSAVLQIILHPEKLMESSTTIPYWLLLFGGVGIVVGLATYGWRVIETIGKNISQLTPTRGFCAEFSASITIIVASKMGLPISTTHAIVGAVLGVGMARGLSALNFRVIRDIFMSWIITLPFSALTSILLFALFKAIFL
jgi:phosphate/sulfate permease